MTTMKRLPGTGIVLISMLLLISLGGVWWWQLHPNPKSEPDPSLLAELDVVCLGRIDSLHQVIALEPIIPGRVMAILVTEGQTVTAQTPLLRLDDETAQIQFREASIAVEATSLEVKLAQQELLAHSARKEAIEANLQAASSRVRAAEKLYVERRKQEMFTTITPAELMASEAEVEQFRHLEQVEKARLRELTIIDPQLRIDAAQIKHKSSLLALEQAKKLIRDCNIMAPADGIVLRVMASPGELVTPGSMQPAIIFRPAGPLVVRAELDQEFLGRVKVGQKATICDEARANAPLRQGHIERIGNWVARKRSMVLEPGEVNDVRTVECIIMFDEQADELLIGQRVRVRITR